MDIDIHESAPETKAGIPDSTFSAISSVRDEMMRTLEAFREANDQRLAEIEQRGAADPVLAEKVAKLDTAVDEHQRRFEECR